MKDQRSEAEKAQRVAETLHSEGFRVDRQVALGGLAADIVASTRDGRRFLVEVKNSIGKPQRLSDYGRYLHLARTTLGLDGAFVVVDAGPSARPEGVILMSELPRYAAALVRTRPRGTAKGATAPRGGATGKSSSMSHLRRLATKGARSATLQPRAPRGRARLTPAAEKPQVFIAMPFDLSFNDVFFCAMVPAARACKAVCRPVNREEFSGDIIPKIRALIEGSDAVIADLSGSRPNVLYEAGYAHALEKPTVHICSTSLARLPFDVSTWNTIAYKKGQTYNLRRPLISRLKAALVVRSSGSS